MTLRSPCSDRTPASASGVDRQSPITSIRRRAANEQKWAPTKEEAPVTSIFIGGL
jgi:hypothetical protein